jgi:diguanylate cyclase (GGDEF)-like protein
MKEDDSDFTDAMYRGDGPHTVVHRVGDEGTQMLNRRAASIQPAVVVVQGDAPGRVIRLKHGKNLIGRDAQCDVCINQRAASRRHAVVQWSDDSVVIQDLQSTNGTRVNGIVIAEPVVLLPGALIKIGSYVLKYIASLLDVEMLEAMHTSGTTDELTGALNKAQLLLSLTSSIEMARDHAELSLIVLDLDFFKRVNDTHGHIAGDFVLKECCRVIKMLTRAEDLIGRFGGEEFVIVLPESSLETATRIAQRICESIANHDFVFSGKRIAVTVSIGVCVLTPDHASASDLIAAADAMLYKSKRDGRNRVTA